MIYNTGNNKKLITYSLNTYISDGHYLNSKYNQTGR